MAAQPASLLVNQPPRRMLLAGLLLAIGVPALPLLFPFDQLFPGHGLGSRLLWGESQLWLLALGLLGLVRFGEKQSWRSLGFRSWRASTLGWGLLAGVLMLLAFPLVQLGLKALGVELSQTQGLNLRELPIAAVLALALRAGIVEELVYRGYVLERLAFLSGRLWVGALLSLVVFVAVHLKSWSLGHLLYVAVAGGLLTGLYLWRRDLLCNMIAHVVTDALGLMAMRMAPQ